VLSEEILFTPNCGKREKKKKEKEGGAERESQKGPSSVC
jgi:hypothetical protein